MDGKRQSFCATWCAPPIIIMRDAHIAQRLNNLAIDLRAGITVHTLWGADGWFKYMHLCSHWNRAYVLNMYIMYIYALAFSDWLIKYALVLPSSRNQVPLANMHPIINLSNQLLKDKSEKSCTITQVSNLHKETKKISGLQNQIFPLWKSDPEIGFQKRKLIGTVFFFSKSIDHC